MRNTRSRVLAVLAAGAVTVTGAMVTSAAQAQAWTPITGSGSTWAQGAVEQWRQELAVQDGLGMYYAGSGSRQGRLDFIANAVDFAVSDTPFLASADAGLPAEQPTTAYGYVPLLAGGTSLVYNVRVGGQPITGLRLSAELVAKIFTGLITTWDDAAIAAENPNVTLPHTAVTPVVRADASGSTAVFTQWLAHTQPALWADYCSRAGRTPCGPTQLYPVVTGTPTLAKSGSNGVAGYVKQSYADGAIGYVETSYALNEGLPSAALRNASGAYVTPSAAAVTAALADAPVIHHPGSPDDGVVDLGPAFDSTDPAAYPISSIAYLIVPHEVAGTFTEDKGRSLARFGSYALCAGQASVSHLGYAPLPASLVRAGLGGLPEVPGAGAVDYTGCPGTGSPADVQVSVALPQQTPVTDGALSLTVPSSPATLAGSGPWAAGADYSLNGTLGSVTVTDGRAVSAPGWDVSAHVSDFAGNGGGTVGAQQLGWQPKRTGGAVTDVGLGPSVAPGSAGSAQTARVFAWSAGGPTSVGAVTLDADLTLVVPSGSPDNRVYSSTVTIDLISR